MHVSQVLSWVFGITVVVILVLHHSHLATSANEFREGIPKTFDFAAYVEKYRKAYNELETVNRAKLFYVRTLGIFKTNVLYATHRIDYYLHQNQYTDLSPSEMKEILADPNSDLQPVEEAKLSPDTPADRFVLDEQGTPSNEYFEPMTRTSLGESSSYDDDDSSPMSFFKESGKDVDPKKLLHELLKDGKLANDMARMIEIEAKKTNSEKYQIKKERQANAVVYKPYIEATNKKFDPSLIPTQSWAQSTNDFSKRFADSLMEDFVGNLEPYPEPIVPKHKVLPTTTTGDSTKLGLTTSSGSYLSGFVNSIKEMRDYFLYDFSEINDIDDEEQVEAQTMAPPKPRNSEIVFDIDWRKTGCISAIKSQGHCNSCATFASLDLLEFLYCRQLKTSTEFSAQFLIDCGQRTGLRGCQGGKLSNVGMFIKKNGLQLNSVYPYQAREQQCPYEDEADSEKSYMLKPDLTGWRLFPQISAWYKWIPKSPIIVGINMPADFLGYSGGIHDGNNCVADMVHAMLLVGSGKQDGKPFWLLKNSFSDTWGEEGYFRLSKKAPIKCFNSAVVALAKFNQR